jgi:hypothetical protein
MLGESTGNACRFGLRWQAKRDTAFPSPSQVPATERVERCWISEMRTLKLVLGILCFIAALLPSGLALLAFLSSTRYGDITGIYLALILTGLAAALIYAGWLLIVQRDSPLSRSARILLLLFFSGIGVLGAVALPNFIKARTTSCSNACVNNLRQIDAAAQEFALEHGRTNGEAISYPTDLTPYIKLNTNGNIPPCPQGGIYSINKVGDNPTCSFGTTNWSHVLP